MTRYGNIHRGRFYFHHNFGIYEPISVIILLSISRQAAKEYVNYLASSM